MKITKESLLKVIGAADDVISALAGTNDEFHKDDTDKMVRLWDDLNDQYAPPEVVRELARLALATMDSEPVGKPFMYGIADPDGNAHIDDFCVSEDRGLVEDTVNELNYDREEGDDLNYSVVALYRHSQPAPEYPETLPCPVLLEPGLRFGKGIKTSTMLAALSRRAVYESDLAALSPEERVEFQAGIEDVKALIAQPAPVVPDDVRQALCKMDDEIIAELDAEESACRAAMLQGADGKPHLTVWYGSMPETNGKTNWTAILHRKGECLSTGITVCRSEYPDRVRYEADRMRHLIGDLADEPNILAYDADAHSGYVPPAAPQSPGRDTATVPGKWIPVSERIPIPGVDVLVAKEFFGPGDWRRKVGHVRHEESGWNIYGASWEPTHWMPLPAAPQEVK